MNNEQTKKTFSNLLRYLNFTLISVSTIFAFSFHTKNAHAYDFYWTGNYSAEGNYFNNLNLGNSQSSGEKSYINHHLFLKPEVVLFSGLSVKGALDVLNSGTDSLPSSQRIGHVLGGSLTNNETVNGTEPVFLDRILEKNRPLNLSEAYFEFAHTNGTLTLGRVPLEFGLGAFYSKGHGIFDHFYTNRDGLTYDFQFGNLYFKPMFYFLSDSVNTSLGRVIEYGLEFHFKVEDSGLDLGALFLQRNISSETFRDANLGVVDGEAKPLFFNIFYKRKQKSYAYALEAFLQSGDIGQNQNGDEVSLDGFGLAVEANYMYKEWDFKLKTGFASGNDTSDTSYSAVGFHRNYDIGLILFNHPLSISGFDPLQTNSRERLNGQDPSNFNVDQTADTDRVSNSIYFSPTVDYTFNQNWELSSTLVFAWLSERDISGSRLSPFLGTELDLTLTYKPTQNIVVATTAGYLMPGSAFEGLGSGANSNLSTGSTFGATLNFGVTF